MKKDIYIIKNKINDKVYIGQAANTWERWWKHLSESRRKKRSLIGKAIAKYGQENFYFEILESQIENFDEREQFWIKEYNSQQPNGYNISPGGKSVGAGTEVFSAAFNEENLKSVMDEIKNSNTSFIDLAKKYGCSLDTISAINIGVRYHQDDVQYPLRPRYRINQDIIKHIIYALQYENDKSITDIAEEYEVKRSLVTDINYGRTHRLNGKDYPLRKSDYNFTNKRDEKIKQVVLDIKETLINERDLSIREISKKFNVSFSFVSAINNGRSHHDLNLSYPLNGKNKFITLSNTRKSLDFSELKLLEEMLIENKKSITEIAVYFNISVSMVYNLNSGNIKKYFNQNRIYPLRKPSSKK